MTLLLFLLACGDPVAPTPPSEPAAEPDPTGPELRTGSWSAELTSPGGALPFGLDLSEGNGRWDAWLINGDERQRIAATVSGDQLTLDLSPYDARIVATLSADGKGLEGQWSKVKRGTIDQLPFTATWGRARRFEALRVIGDPPSVDGRWKADFASDDDVAVLMLDHPEGGIDVTGTVLTTLGDYRFLEGSMEGDTLRLSTFDGSHAFLFQATLTDGTLSGDFWSGSTWHETWTATPDADVTLADPMGLTRTQEHPDWSALAFPDLDGKTRSLDDPEWHGHPHLVQIMGSWCPNCNDQTDLLVELHRRYSTKGLRVVSLAFEHGEPARNTAIVQRYADRHDAPWTYLIAGSSDKKVATAALPIVDQVRAYPTLLFVRADGTVIATHTGFTGPAAPDEHRALVATYERWIETLVGDVH